MIVYASKTKEMKPRISQAAAAWFILLFVYTGVTKLLSLASFQKVLSDSSLLRHFSVFVSWSLPLAELVVAALLLFPATRKAGLYVSLVLVLLFTAYIGWMLLYAPHLPCSCGGVISALNWKQHFFFNLFCIALAIAGIRTIPGGVSRKP